MIALAWSRSGPVTRLDLVVGAAVALAAAAGGDSPGTTGAERPRP